MASKSEFQSNPEHIKKSTSRSETGHARNVANLETMISFCTAYGTTYNPSKQTLKIPSLNTLLTSSRESIGQVTNTKNTLDLVINERQIKYAPLKSTSTRIISALTVSDASAETVADAKSINMKIQGRRSSAKPAESIEKKVISTSQQSYDSLLDNFLKLVDLVASEPNYSPNETELQVQTIKTYSQELQTANTAVINANTVYSNAKIARDNTLYKDDTGMVDIALDAKTYVKSVFGSTSPQYKQISKINFRK